MNKEIDINSIVTNLLIKNKIIPKNHIKSNLNIKNLIIETLVESLNKDSSAELSNLGILKKKVDVENEKNIKIDFIANQDIENKIIKNFLKNKSNIIKNNKKFSIKFLILLGLILLPIIFFLLFNITIFKINNNNNINNIKNTINQNNKTNINNKSFDNKNSNNNKYNTDNKFDNKKDNNIKEELKKETIDLKNENIYYTDKKDLIIVTKSKKDDSLKTGEFKEEYVEIDGRKYKKITYIIKKDDTLWAISGKFLNDSFRWPFIHNINKYIINPDLIYPGDPLLIYAEENK